MLTIFEFDCNLIGYNIVDSENFNVSFQVKQMFL